MNCKHPLSLLAIFPRQRRLGFLMLGWAALLLAGLANLPAQSAISPETILVEGGSFQMGTNDFPTSTEGPAHQVDVRSFRLGISEITYEQFAAFVAESGYVTDCEKSRKGSYVFDNGHVFYQLKTANWRKTNFAQSPQHPLLSVSWLDTIHYANWLSSKDGLQAAYVIDGQKIEWLKAANGWRLPTEAEWEFAARGGNKSKGLRYAGSAKLDEVAWYDENSHFVTWPVKQKKPNELGLYDMCGNVYEWCWDWYGSYSPEAASNPSGPPTGIFRSYRGGSWYSGPWVNEELRVTTRSFGEPSLTYNYNGLRLARNPD